MASSPQDGLSNMTLEVTATIKLTTRTLPQDHTDIMSEKENGKIFTSRKQVNLLEELDLRK
jgi:hypothetical protein